MNPSSHKEAVRLAKATDMESVVLAPPHPFLSSVKGAITKAKLGAQDVFYAKKGAHTGQVSLAMLKSIGVSYVILGHSEKRALGETDMTIQKKIESALSENLKAVLCIGESLAVRRKGLPSVKNFLKGQLERGLKNIGKKHAKNILIAYEPIWAISTAKKVFPESPEDAAFILGYIRETLRKKFGKGKIKLLYGGSVNAKNIEGFLQHNEVHGVLVGGASLKPQEFKKMTRFI